MVALLGTWRERAIAETRGFWTALLCGYLVAQALTMIASSLGVAKAVTVIVTVVGDSLGFYGILWFAAYRKRHAGPGRAKSALAELCKKYWLAETIDNWLRAGLLVLVGLWVANASLTTFLGNLLADIFFFGMVIVTGAAFSDWCVWALRNLLARLTATVRANTPNDAIPAVAPAVVQR